MGKKTQLSFMSLHCKIATQAAKLHWKMLKFHVTSPKCSFSRQVQLILGTRWVFLQTWPLLKWPFLFPEPRTAPTWDHLPPKIQKALPLRERCVMLYYTIGDHSCKSNSHELGQSPGNSPQNSNVFFSFSFFRKFQTSSARGYKRINKPEKRLRYTSDPN